MIYVFFYLWFQTISYFLLDPSFLWIKLYFFLFLVTLDIDESSYELKKHAFREREHKWEGERERRRESRANSGLSTEPNLGLDSATMRSWPDSKAAVSATNCTTQAPQVI